MVGPQASLGFLILIQDVLVVSSHNTVFLEKKKSGCINEAQSVLKITALDYHLET